MSKENNGITLNFDMNEWFSFSYSFEKLKIFLTGITENQERLNGKNNTLEFQNKAVEAKVINWENIVDCLKNTWINNNFQWASSDLPIASMASDNTGTNITSFNIANSNKIFNLSDNNDATMQLRGKDDGKQQSHIPRNSNNAPTTPTSPTLLNTKQVSGEVNTWLPNQNKHQTLDRKNSLAPAWTNPIPRLQRKNTIRPDNETTAYLISQIDNISNTVNNWISVNEALKNQLSVVSTATSDHDNTLDVFKASIEDINTKIADFNIYELFKDAKSDNGTLDVSHLLVENLDKKFTTEIERINKNVRVNSSEAIKNKNDIINNKSLLDGAVLKIKQLREELATKDKSTDLHWINNKQELMNEIKQWNRTVESLGKTVKNIEKTVKEIQDEKDLAKETEEDKEKKSAAPTTVSNAFSVNDYQTFKDVVVKKINDWDKRTQYLLSFEAQIGKIKEENNAIKEQVNKMNAELKKDISVFKDKAIAVEEKAERWGESVDIAFSETEKISTELKGYKGKIDMLNTLFTSIKQSDMNSNPNKNNKMNNTKLGASAGMVNQSIFGKWIDIGTFNEFLWTYNKDLEKQKKINDEMSRNFLRFHQQLPNKADLTDIKSLEEYWMSYITEIQSSLQKKYIEKFDVNKNFKYVDNQIKQIFQIINKTSDSWGQGLTGSNWWVAKRPINGYSCVCCDNYVGDIANIANANINANNENEEKVNYRKGNGMSRIWSMFNVWSKGSRYETKEVFNRDYDSDDDLRNYEKCDGISTGSKKPKMKIKINKELPLVLGINSEQGYATTKTGMNKTTIINKINSNNNNNNNVSDQKHTRSFTPCRMETKDNEDQPKILKIYKVSK